MFCAVNPEKIFLNRPDSLCFSMTLSPLANNMALVISTILRDESLKVHEKLIRLQVDSSLVLCKISHHHQEDNQSIGCS